MNKDHIFNLIVSYACQLIPKLEGHQFKPGDRLADLGANSVDRAEIIIMAMEALSLHIPRVELFGANNIGELVDVLYEKSQK
ncbi:MAG: poly(3-hydroxyalkanoate) depolymerase [Peptococcaceae bacterium BICA1-7]|nr:MAG: poly(3-hydroxyalkanoate) depolymerase [Peptococcaceae bacterium BICA1-7]